MLNSLTIFFYVIKINIGEIDMVVMFVRHAEDVNDVLTKRGKKQCEMMIDYDETYSFSKIYTSPAKRCVDTAKELNKKFNLEIVVEDRLIERQKLANNVPQNKEEQEWYDNYLNPEFSYKNPEGCKEYLQRVFECLNDIIDKHSKNNENVIIVAHSGTMYALSAYVHGIKQGEDIKWVRVSNCAKIYFEFDKKV